MATCGFSDENFIGEDGFGVVHRGTIRGTKVAVKQLTKDGERQLKSEIHALARYMYYIPLYYTHF